MKLRQRLIAAIAVIGAATWTPRARALVSLEDGRDHLYVDGSYEFGYDSNVFANSKGGGSMVSDGTLSVEFARRAGLISVTASASLNYSHYGSFHDQDFLDPSFSADFSKETGRTTGSLLVSAQRTDRADVDVNTRDISWNYGVGLTFQYPVIERYSISGSFNYDYAAYDDRALFSNLATYAGDLYLYYVLNEQRDLFIDGRERYSADASGQNYLDDSLSGGVSGKVYGPFNGSLQMGYQYRTPHGGADQTTTGDLTASGSTTWNISRRMVLTADLSRDFSTTAESQSISTSRLGLTFQDSFTAKASATLEADTGQTRFLGDQGVIDGDRRVDTFVSFSIAYFYTVNQHLKLSVNYSYYQNWSSLAFAEFPRHQVNFTISSHW